MSTPPHTEEYFTCDSCNRQIVPHTTTSWRTDEGAIVSLAQYADIAALIGDDENKQCLCVECYRSGSFTEPPEIEYQIHLQAGRNYQLQGQVETALTAFDAALALKKTAELYSAIGLCRTAAGHFEQAAEAFGSGLAIDRHDPECLAGGINLFIENRQLDLAEEWLKIAGEPARGDRSIDPPNLFFLRAKLALLREDLPEAERFFAAGLQLISGEKDRTDYIAEWKKIIAGRSSS